MRKKIKQTLINEIKKIKIEDLLLIRIFGSFLNKNKLDKVNDIDLLIIVKNLNPEKFEEIKGSFEKISNKLTTKKLKFMIETKLGPIKPKPVKNKKIMQLHLLIWDKKNIEKTARTPILIDLHYHGKEILNNNYKLKVKNLTKKSVLEDFKIHLNSIKEKKKFAGEYIIKENKLIQKISFIQVPRIYKYEIAANSVIMSYLNYLRLKNPRMKKDKKKILTIAKKNLPKKEYLTLRNSFKIKEQAKNNEMVSEKEGMNLETNSIELIKLLESKIKKDI